MEATEIKQQTDRLEVLVQQIGEAVLTTTETIESLAARLDGLSQQVEQQSYQIFALSEEVKGLASAQQTDLQRFVLLAESLERLASSLKQSASR